MRASKTPARRRPPAPQAAIEPRRRAPSLWGRIPAAGKWAAAGTAILAFLGAIAGGWVSWGLPYPALRPGYDSHIEQIISGKVSEVDKKVGTVSVKADRNNYDQLETKLATLAVHESLLRAQLTAMMRDRAYANSFSLQNQAADIKRHMEALQVEHASVTKRMRELRE